MQALIEHISVLLQNRNAVAIAEAPIVLPQETPQQIEETTSVWSFYFNSYSKNNTDYNS